MKKNKRKFGDILLDLEEVLDEMIDDHDVQWSDILSLIHSHLVVHRPDAQEEYTEGGNPVFYYGPKKD
jgi:hypothetical protein